MNVKGEYILYGQSNQATRDAIERFESMGLESAKSGAGMAVGIGEVVESATVALFLLHNVASVDAVGAAQTLAAEVRAWFKRDGSPLPESRNDMLFQYEKTAEYERFSVEAHDVENLTPETLGKLISDGLNAARNS